MVRITCIYLPLPILWTYALLKHIRRPRANTVVSVLRVGHRRDPPSSFVGELMVHLLRSLPEAIESPEGAATFIECLAPFEGLEDYVLPSSLYRYLASADEPRLLTPRCPDWKRRRGQHLTEVEGGAFQPTEKVPPAETGLQLLREYLCMNGMDSIECGRRTVVATLTRALCGSWDGSATMGRELFDQSVLQNPDRSGPVSLGLEMLLQSLVQEEFSLRQKEGKDAMTEEIESSSTGNDIDRKSQQESQVGDSNCETSGASCARQDRDEYQRRGHDRGTATSDGSDRAPQRADGTGHTTLPQPNEISACVAIVGNYVRADGETAGLFFRDLIPTVLLMAGRGSSGSGRGQSNPTGIPQKLAALFQSLVATTRLRASFNVEKMILHTVREIKDWDDPSVVLSFASATRSYEILSDLDEDSARDEKQGKKVDSGARAKGAGEKRRRQALVMACLDVIGPTDACSSLIRREMVEGEGKATLRQAVIEALLEYRRVGNSKRGNHSQSLSLAVLSLLAVDISISVRMSALSAIGEVCPPGCAPAAAVLLERCLDASPKVRCLAMRLLLDEFGLGAGRGGASLAREVFLETNHLGSGAERNGECGLPILGRLLRHQQVLEETDTDRFPILLRSLVRAVLFDEGGRRLNIDNSSEIEGKPHLPKPSKCPLLDPEIDPEGCIFWADLTAPAARLYDACRPFSPCHFEVLDKVIGQTLLHGYIAAQTAFAKPSSLFP